MVRNMMAPITMNKAPTDPAWTERGVSYNPNSFWSDYRDSEEYQGNEDKDYLNDPEDALKGTEVVVTPGEVRAEGFAGHCLKYNINSIWICVWEIKVPNIDLITEYWPQVWLVTIINSLIGGF